MLRERVLQHFCVGCSAEKHFRHWSTFQAVPRADRPIADERLQERVFGFLQLLLPYCSTEEFE